MTTAPRNARACLSRQTSAHLGPERVAWVTSRADAAGLPRAAFVASIWPRDEAGALALVQPRHPRAPMPLGLRGYTAASAGGLAILTLHGPAWTDAGGPDLRGRLTAHGRGWSLSSVVRAVIDTAVEAGA
jgi:hypothetical protein